MSLKLIAREDVPTLRGARLSVVQKTEEWPQLLKLVLKLEKDKAVQFTPDPTPQIKHLKDALEAFRRALRRVCKAEKVPITTSVNRAANTLYVLRG